MPIHALPIAVSLSLGVLLLTSEGCVRAVPSKGGGQGVARKAENAATRGERRPTPADVAVPAGYRIEVVATGLNLPTGVAFDDQSRPHVTEAGYSYGELFGTPQLVRIDSDGQLSVVATGDKTGPWNGVEFHNGAFFISEGGELTGGRISRVTSDGKITPLIQDLPSMGDHHTNGPVVSGDGFVYFGVGTATNSGVVGVDNFQYGWPTRFPKFHDIPAKDVTLAGQNFASDNPFTPEKDEATTGAYMPFGTASQPGQVVKGQMPANGAVYRIASGGGEPELVAWGMRNPWGFAFAPDGTLFVAENQFDDRGSRPVWGTGDLLWRIEPGLWYGWPDFHGGEPLTWADHFTPPGKDAPKPLLATHPNPPPKPVAKLGVHASACGLDFGRSDAFGHQGEAFVALFGDLAPSVGKVIAPVGYGIVRVDVNTGVIHAFAVNRGESNGPASKLGTNGLERPIAARFDRTGDALYIVDFGVMTASDQGVRPKTGTGVLWRITREGAAR